MTHLAENSHKLQITQRGVKDTSDLLKVATGFSDVLLVRLPPTTEKNRNNPLKDVGQLISQIANATTNTATLIIVGETVDLVHIQEALASSMRYHVWVAIKRQTIRYSPNQTHLPEQHLGALVYTHLDRQIQHTKTRIQYSYCPACDKTTKDYGGKKHTYHEYGTLVSDVWRDISVDLDGNITPILDRFADLFGIEEYKELAVVDLSSLDLNRAKVDPYPIQLTQNTPTEVWIDKLKVGSCLEELRQLPDNSIDFAFADPPYNLKKEYLGYSDDLAIAEYFRWCDEWISELTRVLKPGRTLALLNIPIWAIRHFLYMETILNFQNWITWDALSFPVRLIMPAHYTILCFSKGDSRPLPGLVGTSGKTESPFTAQHFQSLMPLAEGYCLRSQCINQRTKTGRDDRGILTDVWGDIHRIKHNSRRVDHPCQLPPQLMYRLISIYTQPGEIVLDCFNGAGTTTLTAHQLDRHYIGIEISPKYSKIAEERHEEIKNGIDPFRKEERVLGAKNSPVARLKKQKYEVSKKTLQLEVKRIAKKLGHIPSREEVIAYGKYTIRYYDEYFSSWGEVCAAARTTGMSETKTNQEEFSSTSSQPRLF